MSFEALQWHCVLASIWISAGLFCVPILGVYHLTATLVSAYHLILNVKNVVSESLLQDVLKDVHKTSTNRDGLREEASAGHGLERSTGKIHAGHCPTPLIRQLSSSAHGSSPAMTYSLESPCLGAPLPTKLVYGIAPWDSSRNPEPNYLYTMADVVRFGDMVIALEPGEQSYPLRRRGAMKFKRLVRRESEDTAGSTSSNSHEDASIGSRMRVTFAIDSEAPSLLGSDGSSHTAEQDHPLAQRP
ncbi:hypothetical protein CONPUDRAFT_155418 [Coniophora puteana RWD-64-598 SS2]|uniref:Uncharacterized protein n=1 Tax=Coniophora puteana (strain RWD-64-598) TaxID=741705 RepID=A0A5M3MMN7_CONPW|nr:uncharacterized protein CONPUDRAFT_155418 [Coniophora puteana RWD-64-598 SS2]EIW80044.1 hypothetical protein CONPUDRAFT_155418 [Coniophora puteana RWD-64-598 SS2]